MEVISAQRQWIDDEMTEKKFFHSFSALFLEWDFCVASATTSVFGVRELKNDGGMKFGFIFDEGSYYHEIYFECFI